MVDPGGPGVAVRDVNDELRPRPTRSRGRAGRHSAAAGPAGVLRSPLVVVLLAVVLVAATLAVVLLRGKGASPATAVARPYLDAWSKRDFAAMAALVEHPPPNFVTVHQNLVADLGVSSWQYRLVKVVSHGTTADASYAAHVVLAGFGSWDYTGSIRLAKVFGRWLAEWTPATIYPGLSNGIHLGFQRTDPPRAPVLGAGDTVLAGPSNVVTVGLEGDAVTSVSEAVSALTQAGIDRAAINAALTQAAAHPNQFTPVVDLSDARYEQVKPIIFRVPGTRFQRHTGQMTVTPDLAAHVVGSLGPITADELRQLGPPYRLNDTVGQTGIEAAYERQLAGTPAGSVEVVRSDGTVVATPFTVAARPGTPVRTTLDLHTEQAAEAALNVVKLPAALVAIRASTGEVLAAVSRPDSTPFDRSLQGQYPPGSTFKVVTAAALLEKGLSPDSPTTCPKTLADGGRTFTNFEGESASSLSFSRAFAISCNTAFIALAGGLTGDDLITAAGQFGFGATLKPGLSVFGSQIPAPIDEVDKVATAIGQSRVLASPLEMAAVAATVDSGSYRAPRLVAGAPDDTAAPKSLSEPVLAGLRSMMAAVVNSGSGTPARLGGVQVYGKTGTAEFGTANPPMTHAWFIGFRGDVAFAVVVEGGGVGGRVAGPLVAKFLQGL